MGGWRSDRKISGPSIWGMTVLIHLQQTEVQVLFVSLLLVATDVVLQYDVHFSQVGRYSVHTI